MAVENVDCKDGNSIITYARVLLRQAKSAVAHLTAFQKICLPRAQCSKAVSRLISPSVQFTTSMSLSIPSAPSGGLFKQGYQKYVLSSPSVQDLQ